MARKQFDLDEIDRVLAKNSIVGHPFGQVELSHKAAGPTPLAAALSADYAFAPKSKSRLNTTAFKIGNIMYERLASVVDGKVKIARIWEVDPNTPGPVHEAAMKAYGKFSDASGFVAHMKEDFSHSISAERIGVVDNYSGSEALLIYRYYTRMFGSNDKQRRKEIRMQADKVGGLPNIQFGHDMQLRWHSIFAVNLGTVEIEAGPELPSYAHIFAGQEQPPAELEDIYTNIISAINTQIKAHREGASLVPRTRL
jgi:hypothetical protein